MTPIKIAQQYSQMLINQYDPNSWNCVSIECEGNHAGFPCHYCPFSFNTPSIIHDITTIHKIYGDF